MRRMRCRPSRGPSTIRGAQRCPTGGGGAGTNDGEKRTGVTIGSGDVLLLRTGRWEQVRRKGEWNFLAAAAGMHASVARWLHAREVAAIGCDGVSDVMPSGVEGLANPLHELVIVHMGMPIFDNLNLDDVAAAAAARDQWTFLFVGAPLRIPGGTGSPLNPLAVF